MTDTENVVYYLRTGPYVKIGFAASLARRMLAYPASSELLAVEPGDRDTERQRLQQFRPHLAQRPTGGSRRLPNGHT